MPGRAAYRSHAGGGLCCHGFAYRREGIECSGFGLAYMAGNVWETTSTGGPDYRVLRGGSWWYNAESR